MSEKTADVTADGGLLARLEAMQAQLNEQQTEIARLRYGAPLRATARVGVTTAEPKVGRRGMLTTVLGAVAAAAVLTVAKEAAPADAATRATVLTGARSDFQYGLVATSGVERDPLIFLPNLSNAFFGLIGTLADSGIPAPNSAGVFGSASIDAGVLGLSTSDTGVRGGSTSGYGVYGLSQSGPGVFGGSNSGNGVYANSNTATGVYATAPQKAVWGRTTGGIGVFGQATAGGTVQARSYGVYGAAPAPGWAGFFEGNVYVTGQVFQGGAAASTAQAADGSQRTLYSQDSTEPLVEDVGESKLVGGQANVKLDPDFAAIADGGAYHVSLTPRGDSKGLYVGTQTPAGFEVREQQGGTVSLVFSYRIVARRKGATGKRLERLERPKGLSAKELEPPKLPEAVAPPKKPATEPKPERRDAR